MQGYEEKSSGFLVGGEGPPHKRMRDGRRDRADGGSGPQREAALEGPASAPLQLPGQ